MNHSELSEVRNMDNEWVDILIYASLVQRINTKWSDKKVVSKYSSS